MPRPSTSRQEATAILASVGRTVDVHREMSSECDALLSWWDGSASAPVAENPDIDAAIAMASKRARKIVEKYRRTVAIEDWKIEKYLRLFLKHGPLVVRAGRSDPILDRFLAELAAEFSSLAPSVVEAVREALADADSPAPTCSDPPEQRESLLRRALVTAQGPPASGLDGTNPCRSSPVEAAAA